MEFDFEKFKKLTQSCGLVFRDADERIMFFNFLTKNHIIYTPYAATDAVTVYWSEYDGAVRGWTDASYHNIITIDDLMYLFNSQDILDFIESEDNA